MSETIQAETILDELRELTESDRKAVARAVEIIRRLQPTPDPATQAQLIVDGVKKVLDEREKSARSFWRAVFDAGWSGVTQAHAAMLKLFKE